MKSWIIPAFVAAVPGLALAPSVRAAGSSVEVVMQDPSTGSEIHKMQMLANPPTVPAGEVIFHATNESKTLVHEMLVVKVKRFGEKLPYDAKTSEVIERRVRDLGEISDLKPGTSGALTLRLKAGFYVLLCNQPGHYKQGMWTRFTVSP